MAERRLGRRRSGERAAVRADAPVRHARYRPRRRCRVRVRGRCKRSRHPRRRRRGRRRGLAGDALRSGFPSQTAEELAGKRRILSDVSAGRRDPEAVAGVPPDRRPEASRPADPHVRAAREVRRRAARHRPPGARRRGRPRLVRPARPDRRDRALRPGARREVRDVRDRADQGADHRRAARDGLGAALRPGPRARRSSARSPSSRRRLGRAPTDEEIAKKLGITVEELEESLTEIARSSIAALDELWTVRAAAVTRSRSSTRSRTRARPTRRARSPSPSRRRRSPTRSPASPSARSSS